MFQNIIPDNSSSITYVNDKAFKERQRRSTAKILDFKQFRRNSGMRKRYFH